jgi:hypothetical protein
MRKFCLIFFSLVVQAAWAEDFVIKMQSVELSKVAAFEFKILFEPAGSFVIDDSIEVLDKDNNKVPVLFKFADADNSLMRVFLNDGFNGDTLSILGQFNRVNYRGEVGLALASVNVLPNFGKEVDKALIKSRIEITKDDNILQYMGISKACILGPKERIFDDSLFVSIGDIQTYGFTLGRKTVRAKINGQDANIYDNAIIGTMLKVNPGDRSSEVDINLELEVDNQVISKKIGTIKRAP